MDIKINFAELGIRMNCDPRTAKKYYIGETKTTRKPVIKESILTDYKGYQWYLEVLQDDN
ncbi:hypothetical protein AN1V17_02230 [Vallitalea sediminicola]